MGKARRQRRAQERRDEKAGVEVQLLFSMAYDMKLPGGLLRDETPVRHAGKLLADSEAALMRNAIIRALECFGYVQSPEASAGVLAEAINAFPKKIRGNLAVALIRGTGLLVTTDTIPVCKGCKVEQTRTLAPEQPEDADEDADPVMLDTTPHTPECHVHRITDADGRPLNPVEYEDAEVIMVLQPPRYEPLDRDPATAVGGPPVDDSPRSLPPEPEDGYTYEDTAGNPIEESTPDAIDADAEPAVAPA